MSDNLRKILNYKQLGRLSFDDQLIIRDIDDRACQLLQSSPNQSIGRQIADLIPEIFGSDNAIREVLDGTRDDLRLDYLNRESKEGKTQYLNLFLFAPRGRESGLVILEDISEKARMVQEINQQKYELLLYRHSPLSRKQFIQDGILGNSPKIQGIREIIKKLSGIPYATVLLQGESGTGKSLVARVIHYSSMPPDAPLVEINCAALPENLIESELFGYEKGAFTHATAAKAGLFEEAEGGTVFLDEIGELPMHLQAKLLSVLETKKFRRLGSTKSLTVKVRIIAASNRSLPDQVAAGKFREDLFYRLNVVTLSLPPLRELGSDILIFARHFLNIYNLEFKKRVKGFSREAEEVLLHHPWPGNVRELSNCLERAMIFEEQDYLTPEDLLLPKPGSDSTSQPWQIPENGISLEEVERKLILSALDRSGGNKSKAARLLGLSRDTLRYRLEKFDLL